MTRSKSNVDLAGVWFDGRDQPESFDLQVIFGNSNPVELDVGCGKGLFLFNQSRLRPRVNFLGIDWSRTYSRMAAARIVRHAIPNVRIIAEDAWRLFPRFPDHSFHAIHAYFPDPWWKRRHRKRRLVCPQFVQVVHRLLVPGGRLCIATDVQEYFQAIQRVLSTSPYLERLPDPEPSSAEGDLDYLTHFERKYRKVGRSIHRAQYALSESPKTPIFPA